MTDIVEALRLRHNDVTAIKAADEIERLRAENGQLNEALHHIVDVIMSEIPSSVGREFLAERNVHK